MIFVYYFALISLGGLFFIEFLGFHKRTWWNNAELGMRSSVFLPRHHPNLYNIFLCSYRVSISRSHSNMSLLDPVATQSQVLSYSLMYLRQHPQLKSEAVAFASSPPYCQIPGGCLHIVGTQLVSVRGYCSFCYTTLHPWASLVVAKDGIRDPIEEMCQKKV